MRMNLSTGGRMQRAALVIICGVLTQACAFSVQIGVPTEVAVSVTPPVATPAALQNKTPMPVIGAVRPERHGELTLLDNFAMPVKSQGSWIAMQSGNASIAFEEGRAVLDMPENGVAGNLAHLISKTPLWLEHRGDTLNITWDMQLLEDRPNAYGFGLIVGSPEGWHIVAAQAGRKSDDPAQGTPHNIYLSSAGGPGDGVGDNVDHGMEKLHYDLKVTLDNAATGDVRMELRAYARDEKLDAEPEAYAKSRTPETVLAWQGRLAVKSPLPLYFCVERDDSQGDPYPFQARAKMALTNVYTGSR